MDREAFIERVAGRLRSAAALDDTPLPAVIAPPRLVPGDAEAMRRLFTERLAELNGAVTPVPTRAAAFAAIAQLLHERGGASIASPPSLRHDDIQDFLTDDPRTAGFGLSEAEWGIAETGTVVLRHEGERGRAYSLVPPVVGFLLPASRLVPTLGPALAALQAGETSPPACVTFISGASHSADIAGQMCYGVHGPGEAHVWLIEDE